MVWVGWTYLNRTSNGPPWTGHFSEWTGLDGLLKNGMGLISLAIEVEKGKTTTPASVSFVQAVVARAGCNLVVPHDFIGCNAVITRGCYIRHVVGATMLLYSAVPESHKNWISCGILWTQELWSFPFGSGIVVSPRQLMVTALDL